MTCTGIQNKTGIHRLTMAGLLVTMGIVFGDIGTSPLYVMKAVMAANSTPDNDYIIGAVSCVIWTLTLQTTIKYVLIALRADNKGEGGILALYALLRHTPRKWLYIAGCVGAAALIADGVITPAITVTSAVEGLGTVTDSVPVLPVVVVVIVLIFASQQAGTERIGRFFGPFMLLWFLMLGILGAVGLAASPGILKAFNPWYAARLLWHDPAWFAILGAVFLCTTGAEALYSDLGHCGRKNITASWLFVKTMLILNYLGQGAWLMGSTQEVIRSSNPFYAIMPPWFTIAGVAMSTGAAIIASQALLSGSFTIFSEAVNLGLWPRLKIKYMTAARGQLYIPAVNWSLMAGCLLTVAIFRNSGGMEAAYGLAITVTMLMTTLLLALWLRSRGTSLWATILFLAVFASVEGIFFLANASKFVHGGWYSLLVAAVLAGIMIIWHKALLARLKYIDFRRLDKCTAIIKGIKEDAAIAKCASNIVYISHAPEYGLVESKIIYSIINKQPKRADHYWIIRIEHLDEPDTLEYSADVAAPDTLYLITLRLGFRIEPRLNTYVRQIVEDLVAEGSLDLVSTYPSLRSHNIPGDFRFILIRRVFSPSSSCCHKDRLLMQIYEKLRHLGISDQDAFGLDTSMVTAETVPLIINTAPSRRITRVPNRT